MIEQINWVSINDRLPDDEITVMLFTPDLDELCWPGYLQDNKWFYVDGSVIRGDVVHCWAHMPGGPGSQPI
jgi:hypothetical protein